MRSLDRDSVVRVLGIDPGLSCTGVAVLERTAKGPCVIEAGVLRPPPGPPAHRLAALGDALAEVLAHHRPEAAAVERLFFNANVRTAMSVGQAAGVALATCARADIEVAHYTPLEVKQAVVGVGNATKKQVATMVAAVLSLDAPPSPPDVADACALAICHLNRSGLARAVKAALA